MDFIYGYVRVSTTDQKLDRQYDLLDKWIKKEYPFTNFKKIYADKMSGKDFDRIEYQKMKNKISKGDLLVVASLDRLGRNYDMIIEEWQFFKNNGVEVVIIDMPILDTRNVNNDLTKKLIADIVLQLLSYVAETERAKIKERQAQGITAARAKGVHLGRHKYKLPDNFNEVCKRYMDDEFTHLEAAKILGMTRGTFLKYAGELGYRKGQLKNK